MADSLARLLKLRWLLEESSRMELEQRMALAARVRQAREQERTSARVSRARALETISGMGAAEEQARLRTMEWKSGDEAEERERRLHLLAGAASRRVEEGREEFVERRKERRQVESVLEAAQERAREEQERRAQRELDDWFGMKQAWARRRDEP